MKKLEDIPKKEVFTTPKDYFNNLPSAIQARVASHRKNANSSPVFSMVLRYAIPAFIILAGVIFWFNKSSEPIDSASILAQVQTEDLIAYLDDTEFSTEDLLETVSFSADDLNSIEEEVYHLNITDKDLNDAFNEIDLNNL